MFSYDDREWNIEDLLDPDQPFVSQVALARQMLETLESLEALEESNINVRTPRHAIHFMENTLTEWFETIAEIEKGKRGSMPRLVDRSLYPKGEIDWNQGLTLEELQQLNPGGLPIQEAMKHHVSMPSKSGIAKDEPLSGFLNRILPVKFNLRVLSILIFNSEPWNMDSGWDDQEGMMDGVTLTELRKSASSTAAGAKEWLSQIDKSRSSDRGSGISTGFPNEGKKSIERYVAQFVGSRRKGELSGALFEMGFAGLAGFKLGPLGVYSDDIFLTKEGLYFAMLENPVIDLTEDFVKKAQRFSEKECEFLVSHIRKNLPAEWDLMNQVADMIREGNSRASGMLGGLISSRGWDRDKASVMRAAVVARMQEMMLIERIQSGVDVTFELTDSGKKELVRELAQK